MKTILFGKDAREKLLNGVKTLYDAVSATLGAGGRNVMIGSDWQGAPHISKDGVTVARAIVMNDIIEEMGARTLREAANKTAADAGDGTTTSTVLAAEMISCGFDDEDGNVNMVEYKEGMNAAGEKAVKFVAEKSIAVGAGTEMLEQVAVISANGDTYIARVVSEALSRIGKNGVIAVERSAKNSMEIDMEVSEGMEFMQGACSTEFFNDKDRTKCTMNDCYALVAHGDIVKMEEIIGVLKQVNGDNQVNSGGRGQRGLLIIAADVIGEALATLVVNKIKGHFPVCAVRSPGYGDGKKELLQDIATVCGATVINEQNGLRLSTAPLSALGLLKSVTVTKDRTILISTDANKVHIDARAQLIEAQIEAAKNPAEIEGLSVRSAKLRNGVAVLHVGGVTEVEMNERRDRIDDAICATRSALQEGVVAGGGVTYYFAGKYAEVNRPQGGSKSFHMGYDAVVGTLEWPIIKILSNAGFDMGVVKLPTEYPFGIDVVSSKQGNMLDMGIVDPAKVCRVAIQNAVSVAGIFLTTECVISPTFQQPLK